MTPDDYTKLLAPNLPPESRVRQTLAALAEDTRELALLALGEWQLADIPSLRLAPALAALETSSFGSSNGLLLELQSHVNNTAATGTADQRDRLNRAANLRALLTLRSAPLPPNLNAPMKNLAAFLNLDAHETFQDFIAQALALSNQTTYAGNLDPAWWTHASALLLPFIQYMSTDPLKSIRQSIPRRAPWFQTDPAKTPAFSTISPGASSSNLPEVSAAFSRLLSGPELQERDLRRLLARNSTENLRGFLLADFLVGPPVGEGGFGTVHLARQLSTGRKVAVKILRDGMPPETRTRFQREAAFLAQFNNPHIVSVLAHGEAHWSVSPRMNLEQENWFSDFAKSAPVKCFIAMEWIEGQSLAEIFESARTEKSPEKIPSIPQITDWFAQSAHALRLVHGANLVHRDVKPANLMLTDEGVIKLMDFGIVLARDPARTLHTSAGQIVGTETYMSPEQLRADQAAAAVGPAADIYSLAATFYELFTRTCFYSHDTVPPQTITALKRSNIRPAPPRERFPELPWEIETILLGGLEIEVDHRYRSMDDLERDIRHVLRDEPIEYKRPRLHRRIRLAYRRNRTASNLIAAALLAAALGVSFYIVSIRQEQARTLAEKIRAVHLAADNYEERARQEMLSGNPLQSLVLASEAYRLGDNSPALRFLIARGLNAIPPANEPDAFSQPIYSAAFDQTGDRLVTAGLDGYSNIWNTRTGTLLNSFPAKQQKRLEEINSAVFSPDGFHLFTTSDDHHLRAFNSTDGSFLWPENKSRHAEKVYGNLQMASPTRIITASEDHTAILWNALTGDMIGQPIRDAKGPVNSASLSPDGSLAITAGEDGFTLINSADAAILHRFDPNDNLLDARISPDNHLAVTAGNNGLVKLWNLSTPDSPPKILEGHTDRIRRIRFSPDFSKVLSASYDGTAREWSSAGESITVLSHRANAAIFSAEFSPDSKLILTAAADGTACLWQADNGKKLATLRAGYRNVFSANFSPDGKLAATAGQDGLTLWDVSFPSDPFFLHGPSAARGNVAATFRHSLGSHITAAAFTTGGKTLATADNLGVTRIWNAKTHAPITAQLEFGSSISALLFTHSGNQFITGDKSGVLTLRDTDGPNEFPFEPPHSAEIFDLALSPDGKLLASAGLDGDAKVWNLATQKLLGKPLTHPRSVRSVMFSNDSKELLTSCDDGHARIWNLAASTAETVMPPESKDILPSINDARFSPDNSRLVTAGQDQARIWNLNGSPLQSLAGTRLVHARWSPDGTKIVISSLDGAVKLYSESSNRYTQIASLEGHARVVKSVHFSPDSQLLLTAGDDGRAFIWDVNTGQMLCSLGDPTKPLTLAIWSPDGSQVLTAGDDGLARLWNADLTTQSPDQIAAIVERLPWQLSAGRLVRK